MSTLGALIFALIFGAVGYGIFHADAAFWIFFCFSAFIGAPIGMIRDACRRVRESREERADQRAEAQSEAIAQAISKGRPNVNIDARQVHIHED
jgi:hypothetical protein